MKKQMLYRDLAKYYDLIYSFKDYRKEARKIRSLIRKYKKSSGDDLLDVACGTGKHLMHLKSGFNATGTDISPQFLKIARKRVKGVKFVQADMTKLNLGKKFDVILCFFSSIGYVRTYLNLRKTLRNFSNHLKQGGLVVIEPWFDESSYKTGKIHMNVYNGKDVKVARLNVSKKKGDISIVDMHYLIAETNRDVRHFVDRHELGLFDRARTLKIMRESGLRTKFLKNGLLKDRGLFVGVKEINKKLI